MRKLQDTGLIPPIQATDKPLLGVCLGMQLLTGWSEAGNSTLTGIIPVKTHRFISKCGLKIPHTGWNKVRGEKQGPLFAGIPDGSQFYYMKQYYIELVRKSVVKGTRVTLELEFVV